MLENLTGGTIKAAMKDAGASSSDLWMVPIGNIRVLEGFNVRTKNAAYAAHICEIGESILANGYYKDRPLSGFVAREGEENIIYITDGHSRFEAIAYANERGAEIVAVPVVTKPAGTQIEDLTIGLVVSNSGKELTPIEKAAVCKRLIGYSMDEPTIAKRLGFSPGYVKELLILIAAPKKIRTMVESGEISAANACEAIRKHGDKAADFLDHTFEGAKSAGKKKITKRMMTPKRDLVSDGVEWIKDVGQWSVLPDQKLVELLAFLTGASEADILAELEK
jgi:ParB family chromosome partitioning protein